MKKSVAVITGGSSGLGEAAALRFAKDGYDIVLLDVDKTGGERVADAVRALGNTATFHFCDVGDPGSVEAAAHMVSENFGPVEILVTSAALQPNPECIMTMNMDGHDKMWRVNYFGTVYTCQAFARLMIPNNKGSIVTLGSIHSRMPLPLPGYNVIKVAIERFTQLLAVELGRFCIRVNCVGPTHVMTPPLIQAIKDGERDESKIMAPHALPYLPEPEDVADAIAFLASDHAKAITGVLLPVDSGIIAGDAFVSYAGGIPWLK
ncbi:SDR family NAD(P)-dependent oxidoreductase [Brucella pseudogrignonensis]|uniref:SDR family NAD(P)-dependent oxidoreductase n=1 Tax=Brucella pseudogrignonensis TaxID=419475 RepID=UPI003D977034